MKTRILFFLAISAVVTLSFTFVSMNSSTNKKIEMKQSKKENLIAEPVGGLVAEDKI